MAELQEKASILIPDLNGRIDDESMSVKRTITAPGV